MAFPSCHNGHSTSPLPLEWNANLLRDNLFLLKVCTKQNNKAFHFHIINTYTKNMG